jgi:glutamine synthetase
MLVIPDPDSAAMDPFTKDPTLTLICNIQDPITRADYSRDPRNISRKAEAYLKSTGIADIAYFGPEPEFFIFDSLRFDTTQNSSYYFIESNEGNWNSGKETAIKGGLNLGYKVKNKEGYFPVPPTDSLQDIRTEMVLEMERVGIRVEKQHHEVATAGQAEIDMRFQSLTKMADWLTWYKYIVKNVAVRHGMTATFMPKPIFGDNGTGMHTHQSVWKGETPLFAGSGYAGMSEMALHYIAGILHHAPSIAAFTNPGTNSYRRLVPGFEAPINLAYSSRNRSASVRIPMYSPSPKAKRIEVRFPDPTCNPYLAFSAMLMAGIDGIQRRLDPRETARQGHLRAHSGGTRRGAEHARLSRGIPCQPQTRPRVPHEGRRLYRRSDRDLDRLQDGKGSERDTPASASIRVRTLLRRIGCSRYSAPPNLPYV